MKSTGVVDIAGMVNLAGAMYAGLAFSLSQTISEMQLKPGELTIPPGGAFVTIPLNLSDGVTEVLFMLLHSAKPVRVELTSADNQSPPDGGVPGPIVQGLKGIALWTFSLGDGLVGLRVANPDPIDAVQFTYVLAAQGTAEDIPPFWV